MDVNKNTYTIGFTIIMVVVIAAILSSAYMKLKPKQIININLEKKQNILSAIGINVDRDNADEPYDMYIQNEIVINNQGEEILGSAFDIDLSKELKKNESKQSLPLFIGNIEGEKKYIIPLRGKGLWGPIWGFLAFEDDFNKVYGAVFDHKKETPGLGAEINTSSFEEAFLGKTIFEGDNFTSIIVMKGDVVGNMHAVNGISGGTITSDGVSEMLRERLEQYLPYFNKRRIEIEVDSVITEMDTLETQREIILN